MDATGSAPIPALRSDNRLLVSNQYFGPSQNLLPAPNRVYLLHRGAKIATSVLPFAQAQMSPAFGSEATIWTVLSSKYSSRSDLL